MVLYPILRDAALRAAPQDEVWYVASIRSIYFFLFRRRAIMFSPSISAEKAMAA